MKTKLLIAGIVIFQIANSIAQQLGKPVPNADWNKNGKDTIYTMKHVAINTTNPDSAFLRVAGEIKTDSLTVTGGARIKGPLHIGTNSLTLLGIGSTTSDDITSDNGVILLGGNPLFSNIKIGIGNTFPVDALDVTGAIALNGLRALSNFGTQNIFVGQDAGINTTGGAGNSFVGYRAGFSNTMGATNSFFGRLSGFSNITGGSNSFFGDVSGSSNTTGTINSFFGSGSGSSNTTGVANSFFGQASGSSSITGQENSFFGTGSGLSNTTGSNNTYLGHVAMGTATLNKATAIGYRAYVTQDNSVVLGYVPGQNGIAATDPAVNVAIGTTAPSQRLELKNGNFLISNSNNTAGEIRLSEPSGSGTNYTAFKAQAQTADITYTLPAVQGVANTFLKNDGSGNLSWEIISSGSGIGTCTNPTVLSANSGIQLSSNNFYFEGLSATTERVAVGVTCGNTLTAKFNVNGNAVIGNSYIGAVAPPANGLLVQGFTGIGPSFTTSNPPARQLDIFNSNSPQLRLTQTFSGGLFGLPSYTDFQTTSAGNLRINPSDGLFGLHPTVGINVPTGQEPQNTLEIVSGFAAPTPSGLRFRNLTSSAVPVTNPGNGLLSVNSSGDVIYVPGSIGGILNANSADNGLSFSAGHTGNINPHLELGGSLHKNTDIPLDIYSLTFSGPGSVGIGTATPPGSKLKVVNSNVGQWATEISSSYQNSTSGNFGLDVKTNGSTSLNIGIRTSSNGPNSSFNVGIVSSASGGAINRGCEFSAGGGINSYGGQFSAISGTTLNYGILALTTFNDPGVTGAWAGVFVGKVFVTDPMTSISTTIPSDTLLKKDITSFSSGLNIIRNTQPISFKYNGKIGLDSTRNYIGVIAEDLAQIAPYAMDSFFAFLDTTDTQPTSFLSVKSEAIMYTTINAVKELDSMVAPLLSPDVPLLVSPANGTTNLPAENLVFIWNRTAGAIFYFVDISTDSLFTGELEAQFGGSDTMLTSFNSLSSNTTYYWRVIAYKASGKRVSEIWNFTTEPLLAPTLISPPDGATNIPVQMPTRFEWNRAQGSSYYYFEISTVADFSSTFYSNYVNDTTFEFSFNEYNTTYYWRVASVDRNGNQVFSNAFSLTTEQSAVTPPQPSDPSASDIRYKENIADIDSALEKVLQLRGVYFDWKTQEFPDLNFDSTRYMGFIAQEVQPVVPEVIFQNDTGALSMDYGRMVALLVEAMKQQQQTIDSFKNQNADLQAMNDRLIAVENCISNLPPGMCGSARMANPDGGNQQKTTFKEVVLKGEIILDQNNPNPFKESTTITYFIPEYIHFAQIIFSDNTGRIINTVDIDHTGQGQLNVKAEKLGSGLYSYSIIVDGKTVDTKKMIKTK